MGSVLFELGAGAIAVNLLLPIATITIAAVVATVVTLGDIAVAHVFFSSLYKSVGTVECIIESPDSYRVAINAGYG